ncbi:hypothetical protein NQ317_006152 [Molorchus minor]|uniref:DDHD domain-containing protein n=1 Tax=Molorchus minor TaxID=1323400 RepID=A0ABQ9K323_9CUCU|nr:hypothetical protein NQ317_006152 [Molorchus minor]
MNENHKRVINPLFNTSVTGGTFEEFAQNAILLPAREKTPPSTLNLSSEQLLSEILPPKSSDPADHLPVFSHPPISNAPSPLDQPPVFDQFQNQGGQLPTQTSFGPNIYPPSQPTPPSQTNPNTPQHSSNLSSVFSSFSNILNIRPQNTVQKEEAVPAPAGIENIISQDYTNIEPIPLFPTQGAVQFLLFSHNNLPNQFKPISPPPPSANGQSHIPQPLPTIPTQPVGHLAQPFYLPEPGLVNSLQSPVMAAIPASEALSNTLNMVSSTSDQYLMNNNPVPNTSPTTQVYRPVYHHWFYQKEVESKKHWQPFSMIDSLALEQAFTSSKIVLFSKLLNAHVLIHVSDDLDPEKVIPTDGGRFDVNILRRQRTPVYWQGNPSEVRRCSWFHKGSPDGRLVPYEENIAAMLEEEFKLAFEMNQWHKEVKLASGETVAFHAPDVLVVFPPTQAPDTWGNTPNQSRPRVVKRGMDEFDIDEGEPSQVDHILFLVHGIGSVCDFKFRPVEEVVDEFRNIALQLVQSHYRTSCELGIVHRVEVLPISWHSKLHSDETGIDKQLKSITLESIPKLREFTNDTLLDILFYTSPVYCQNIISIVGNELNRVYDLYKQRNPTFNGGVSLGGHSLGSLILFDILCHQDSKQKEETEDGIFQETEEQSNAAKRKISRRISYMMGTVGTGQPQICYPHLNFEPKTFFAIGSPIGMFVIVRGLDTLGENFSLPTCPAFFNIFHPYDPIAYRIESLIHPELGKLKPVLIPHHKGRKRMHLELKETMARVGADLKQKVIDSMKSTWNSFYQFTMFHKTEQPSIEEVQKVLEEQIDKAQEIEEETQEAANIPHGSLNKGRRIDYILQEAPFEFFNDYIFALTSHVCYWESEDTILLFLKEIYSSMNISTDSQIPQQSMTIERPPPSPTGVKSSKFDTGKQTNLPVGVDPTLPMQTKSTLQPPPTTGFIRKT